MKPFDHHHLIPQKWTILSKASHPSTTETKKNFKRLKSHKIASFITSLFHPTITCIKTDEKVNIYVRAFKFPQPKFKIQHFSCSHIKWYYVYVCTEKKIMSCHLCHIVKAPCGNKLWNHFYAVNFTLFLSTTFTRSYSSPHIFCVCFLSSSGKILCFMSESLHKCTNIIFMMKCGFFSPG